MHYATQDCDKTTNQDLYEWMLLNITTCTTVQIP